MSTLTSSILTNTKGLSLTTELSESEEKYDSFNIIFSIDIQEDILSKIDIAYKVKNNLFGKSKTISQFSKSLDDVREEILSGAKKIKTLELDKLDADVEKEISLLVKDTIKEPKKTDIPNLKEPLIYTDGDQVYFMLSKSQNDILKSMDRRGITSVNGKPDTSDDIVHGLTDISITLEDINALPDDNPRVPSVVYKGKFEPITNFLKVATDKLAGIVKFVSDDEIINNQQSDSAISTDKLYKIIKSLTHISKPTGLATGKTYAYKSDGTWVEYKPPSSIGTANLTNYGITRLATRAEITNKDSHFVAVSTLDAENYIQSQNKEPFQFPPNDGYAYGAVNPDEYKDKYKTRKHWVRIYTSTKAPPTATEEYYGTAVLATDANLTNPTPNVKAAQILTPKVLTDYLTTKYSFLGKSSATSATTDYALHYNASIQKGIKFTFVPFNTAIPQANRTRYGKAEIEDGGNPQTTNDTKALTASGFFKAYTIKIQPQQNVTLPNPTKLTADDIFARQKNNFIQIKGILPPATTKEYGIAKVANASADLDTLKTDAGAKSNYVVPNRDVKVIEKAINDYFAKMPKDGKSYLFTKQVKNNIPELGYSQEDLSKLSQMKTIMLDENNEEISRSYQTAIHIVSSQAEMQNIPTKTKDYTINIAQIAEV